MAEDRFYSPFKIGLLLVVIAYLVFNLHTLLTTEWIGEWARTPGSINTIQLIEDINATVGNSFRVAGSIIAIIALSIYLIKKGFPKQRAYLIVRIILVFEAIYWLGLITSAGAETINFIRSLGRTSLTFSLNYFAASTLPSLLESVAIPIVLLVFAYKLSPNKPVKGTIRWGMISGTVVVLVYWLLNTGIWTFTIPAKDPEYLTYPHLMLAYLSTIIGLLALTVYSAYATWKLRKTDSLQNLNLRPIGVIVTGLGVWYLWNYLTWIFFGGGGFYQVLPSVDYMWSSWYAWLLGHNMDLWMLSLPLVGLPLLLKKGSDA